MPRPGRVVLFGSGETSPSGRKVLDGLLRARPARQGASFVILETPAGFEPNSAWVAGQVAEFVTARLAEHRPRVAVIPARRKLADGGTDDPALLEAMWTADIVYLGAGSPTYAVRQLAGSLAWQIVQARLRLGTDLVLASASTLAAGAYTAPIYEIYKVGEDLRWIEGLDIFGAFGPRLAIIPHWNNTDGGVNLDTSFCYMGAERMQALRAMLPAGVITVGIDEHTALVVDLGAERVHVEGNGGITVVDQAGERHFAVGKAVPLADVLGPCRLPSDGEGIPDALWRRALLEAEDCANALAETQRPEEPPSAIVALASQRESARAARDWGEADRLRREIAAAGWEVSDTPAGQKLTKSNTPLAR